MFYTGILAVPLSRRRSDQRKEHIVNNIGDLTLIKRPHRHYEMVLIQVVHDASNSRREARWVDFASRDGIVEYPVEHRSEEHTSELQSRCHLVCRLLLEKK